MAGEEEQAAMNQTENAMQNVMQVVGMGAQVPQATDAPEAKAQVAGAEGAAAQQAGAKQFAAEDVTEARGRVVKLDRGFPLVQLESGARVRCEHATELVKESALRAVIGDYVRVVWPDTHDKAIIA